MSQLRHARLNHAVPEWVSEADRLFFITINCAVRTVNQLCKAEIAQNIFDSVGYNNAKAIWNCRLLLLMPDHLHAIIYFPLRPGLEKAIKSWKRYTARQFGISWQDDFFDHRLRYHQALAEKRTYILMNPVRNGLCSRPEDWPFVWDYAAFGLENSRLAP